MFIFGNNGQDIVETNYWNSEHSKHGYMYLSVNAGCMQLLVPQKMSIDLKDMALAKSIKKFSAANGRSKITE